MHTDDPLPALGDELLDALAQLDAAMPPLLRHAGNGSAPELLRPLDRAARGLRARLGPDAGALVDDVREAAQRVLTAADPAAPLRMLALARHTLATVVHRHALRATRQVA